MVDGKREKFLFYSSTSLSILENITSGHGSLYRFGNNAQSPANAGSNLNLHTLTFLDILFSLELFPSTLNIPPDLI